jgi:hypothetical protein
MTEDECWHIVDLARVVAAGDVRRHADVIAGHLTTWPRADIVAFGRWVRTKMVQANTADVFVAVRWINAANGMPEVSGNSWEFARAWIVARGRAEFAAILADADVLADVFTTYEDFCEGEAIEIAAYRAYELATGSRDYPQEMLEPGVVESFPAAAPVDELTPEELVALFPKLTEKFGPPPFVGERGSAAS